MGLQGANERTAGGWLIVLCAWLGVWQPVNLAVAAAEALAALPVRGWPLAVLMIGRIAVTAVGFAAARLLWDGRPAAAALARVAVLLSGVSQLFVYVTSIAPNNRRPGETPLYIALTILVHAGWLVYLARSRRVRRLST